MKWTTTLVALALLVSSPTFAQETTGSIVGTVTSVDGAPLPGVSVQIEDLDRGLQRIVRSGRTGVFTIAALSPADYRLSANLEGFRSVNRSVHVGLGRTVSQDIVMQVGKFTDEIQVSGATPLLDVKSTVSGFTADADALLSQVPVQREVTQIAMLAPGTYPNDNTWQEARWQLHTPGQGFISFSGSSFGENSYQVNGLNITNFRNMMGSTFVPMEFVEEVQVKTGGYQAEFGRSTGGVINMVTKSGTNTFRGAFSLYWQPEALQEQELDTAWSDNQEESRENLEANASLGGPIFRDHLFFFGFVRYSDARYTDYYTNIADLNEPSAPYWGGKIDWQITSNHRFEGTYLSDDVNVDFTRFDYDPTTRTLLDPRGTGVYVRGGDNVILSYTGVLSPDVLIAAQAGRNEFNRTNFSDGDECPVARDARGDTVLYLGCWVKSFRGTDSDSRNAYRVDLDWFVGDHGLKMGADYELNLAHQVEEWSGGVNWRYVLNGSPDQDPEEYRYPQLPWNQNLVRRYDYQSGGDYEVNSSAAYVQDTWSVTPHLTLDLGLRWERYENKNGLGGTFIETNDQWAPRLGVIWDPSGAGRSKLYASFGTYHLPVSAMANIWFAGATDESLTWYTFDGNIEADGSPTSLGEQLDRFVWFDGETPDPRENISENFEPMAQNELIIGFEQRFGENWRVGVRGVARWYQQVIEDFSIYEGLWNAYGVECLNPDLIGTEDYCWVNGFRLGNPGRDFVGWYDVDGDDELDQVSISADELGYPEAERRYYGVELTFEKRFMNNWMLNGSYTWSHLYGNYEGTISDEWYNDLAGMNQSFDYPFMMEHSSGNLPGDKRHNVKLYGMYSWDFGLQIGGNFFYYTGRPINSYGRHPDDPWATSELYPSFYTDGEPTPRGCCGRTEDVWGLDVLLSYNFHTLGSDWDVRLDVFNVLNNQNVERVFVWAEDPSNGVPEEHYGEPEYYQSPRTVRLGFGLSF